MDSLFSSDLYTSKTVLRTVYDSVKDTYHVLYFPTITKKSLFEAFLLNKIQIEEKPVIEELNVLNHKVSFCNILRFLHILNVDSLKFFPYVANNREANTFLSISSPLYNVYAMHFTNYTGFDIVDESKEFTEFLTTHKGVLDNIFRCMCKNAILKYTMLGSCLEEYIIKTSLRKDCVLSAITWFIYYSKACPNEVINMPLEKEKELLLSTAYANDITSYSKYLNGKAQIFSASHNNFEEINKALTDHLYDQIFTKMLI